MNLQFKVLGVTLASVELTFDMPTAPEVPPLPTPVKDLIEGGVEKMSTWWVDRMMRKRK
jgi:hypothetical protein